MDSPCLTCKRVRDPHNCESKVCKEWRSWFITRWESMRTNVQKSIRQSPAIEKGVPLGGQKYASPHQVRDFLRSDPCQSCYCPKDLCTQPCQLKLAWRERKGEHR